MFTFFISKGLPIQNSFVMKPGKSVILRRNLAVNQIVLPKIREADWFIFIDYDHYPVRNQTDLFLDDVQADVVGCTYDTGNNASWLEPNQFHMGLCRFRGEVFTKISAPWFMFEYNKDGTQVAQCECGYLRQKLIQAGVSITRRGYVGHRNNSPSWVNCV